MQSAGPARVFGLLGKKLGHSFSPQFFNEMFTQQGLPHRYVLLERPTLRSVRDLPVQVPGLAGFNVTIPYKQEIIPLLDEVDGTARALGAVNTVAITRQGRWLGFNTDVTGFAQSLTEVLGSPPWPPALLLGSGGAAAAVRAVLQPTPTTICLRQHPAQLALAKHEQVLRYEQVDADTIAAHPLIINATPVGMHPDVGATPPLPYEAISAKHVLFDLIYNPAETEFLRRGRLRGARTQNGLPMLHYQALAAWVIWQQYCGV